MSALLEVRGLGKSFRGIRALHDVDLTVHEGQVLGVVGPNGAGKTTCFNCITGASAPDTGTVRLAGRDVTGLPAHRLAMAGLVRTFQLMRPFASMTVVENVEVAALSRGDRTAAATRTAHEVLGRTGLADWAGAPSATLPTAMRKRLELARALALRPRVLLLDEVLAGLVPAERAPVLDLLADLREHDGTTIVFVEHIMAAVRRLCDQVVVLDQGAVLAAGDVEPVLSDPAVVEAYLGQEYSRA